MKAKILTENGVTRYFDKNGVELHDGDVVVDEEGAKRTLYLTAEGELGTDATNPRWIESGRAVPGEYGIYPLTESDLAGLAKSDEV